FFSYRPGKIRVLDVGCGAGFLSNYLGREGFSVTAIDLSVSSLEVARRRDETKQVHYLQADAYDLPFDDGYFDVVTSTDFLEHVSEPKRVLKEISRVLGPSGFFFFHTFNRNWISKLLAIKSLEWFVKNTPEHLHVYDLFIKPKDLKKWMEDENMEVLEMHGIRPKILQLPVWRLLTRGEVDPRFRFKWSSNLAVSYMGIARKGGQREI
ncbi:MAG: bifunctional 2-polyprenyl-6-hydroxyphenol methylase/3-demethylubiquinol 3-O-methyltransferase UbiG, partial [Pseudobdellovibrionaceae bacterium]